MSMLLPQRRFSCAGYPPIPVACMGRKAGGGYVVYLTECLVGKSLLK